MSMNILYYNLPYKLKDIEASNQQEKLLCYTALELCNHYGSLTFNLKTHRRFILDL